MFSSVFVAGFECSTGYNKQRQWFDHIVATRHDILAHEDYGRIASIGIKSARDGIRWPLVDRAGRYDFSSAEAIMRASREHGVQVIWDLFHYGYPDDLDPFSEDFTRRFADYCHAAAAWVARHSDGPYYFTPVNEPSYLSYTAGEIGVFAPHVTGRGWELKVCLIKAAIQGINAIRSVIPDARMVNADPFCRVVPPYGRPDLAPLIDDFNQRCVFQSWDMLCGRLLPELGGSRAHLDILGINYYWTNQWEMNGGLTDEQVAPLPDDDPRRWPLHQIVRSVWERYGGDIMITETGHVDDRRAPWMQTVLEDTLCLWEDDIPLRGVCLYPILGMPEWHTPGQWTRMGLWEPLESDTCTDRETCAEFLSVLRDARALDRLYRSKYRHLPADPPPPSLPKLPVARPQAARSTALRPEIVGA